MQENAFAFDLVRYFARIHYAGATAPTLATLNALTRAHATAIPFENVDVLLRRSIDLAPQALFRQLVLDNRGGYCFQQNGLLLLALRALGFHVRPVGARVRLGVTDRATRTRRTHMLLLVQFAQGAWVTDVGVGSATLTAALRLVPEIIQATPHEPRRLQWDGARWYHQILRGGAWADVYDFTLDEFPLMDRELANWYTSTSPDTHFHDHLSVALPLADGTRIALADHELRTYAADGTQHATVLARPEQITQALAKHFGIHLPSGAELPRLPEDAAPPAPAVVRQ